MADNKSLTDAKKAKQDEFYTQLEDIEREMHYYRDKFKGARVLCNCDDPRVSNFVRYFLMHFNSLGLKHLAATCWKNTNPDLFSQGKEEHAIRLDWDGTLEPYRYPEDVSRMPYTMLKGDGDFRSDEVKAILAESDIVVTNPPFSLFREYVTQLVESGKKFLIIGNQNALTYNEVFPLVMKDKVWLGYCNGAHDFMVPADRNSVKNIYKKDGQYYAKLGNICWYTNLDVSKRHKTFETGAYIKRGKSYEHYDNYDAIEVPAVRDIPMDYDGVMGVPITFLDRYNPDIFEIVGRSTDFAGPIVDSKGKVKQHPGRFYVNGKRLYDRLLIRFRR